MSVRRVMAGSMRMTSLAMGVRWGQQAAKHATSLVSLVRWGQQAAKHATSLTGKVFRGQRRGHRGSQAAARSRDCAAARAGDTPGARPERARRPRTSPAVSPIARSHQSDKRWPAWIHGVRRSEQTLGYDMYPLQHNKIRL